MERPRCLCGFEFDMTDLFCRICGRDCDPKWNKETPYATVLTCKCCGDDADKDSDCRVCGANPTKMTKEGFTKYRANVNKEYAEIDKKAVALRMKRGALNRLSFNLKIGGDNCKCTGTSPCRYHSEYADVDD